MARCLGVKFYAVDAAGAPLALGKVYTYEPGGVIAKKTYSNAALTVENDNPVILDAGGQADIYLSGLTKMVIKTAAGVTVKTVDKVGGVSTSVDTVTTTQVNATGSIAVGDDLTVANDVIAYSNVTVGGNLTIHDNYVTTIRSTCAITGAVSASVAIKAYLAAIITNYVNFSTAVAPAAVAANSIFLDSTDNKIRLKVANGDLKDLY